MKIGLMLALAVALCTLTGCLLYRHFVTDRIMDGGDGMENPDARRSAMELVELSWWQNHMYFGSCFSLQFYLIGGEPALTGSFLDQNNGEDLRESQVDAFSHPIAWPVTWVQWYELQQALEEQELPEYSSPSDYACDETDSMITVVWRTDDGTITQTLDGRYASELETLALRIAQEAYDAAQTQPASEDREVSDMAELTRFYWTQSAMTQDRSFQFAIGRGQQSMIGFLPADMDDGVYFSYSYRDSRGDGQTVRRTDVLLPEQTGEDYLSRLARALREQELPAYRAPEPHLPDATDSYMSTTWSDADASFSRSCSGEDAQPIYDLLVEFAGETNAWLRSQDVPEGGWRCEACGMANGKSVFCAECGSPRPAKK